MNELQSLAETIHQLETTGMEISSGWYDFEPVNSTDVVRLTNAVQASLDALRLLAKSLNRRLLSPVEADRDNLQYAYNLSQELIQSRTAVLQMLTNLHWEAKDEYYRALAIKEKAAKNQAQTLTHTLSAIR